MASENGAMDAPTCRALESAPCEDKYVTAMPVNLDRKHRPGNRTRMSEKLKLFDGTDVTVVRDNSSYPERFSLTGGQERILESAILQLVRKKYGATNAESIPEKAPSPANQPVELEGRKVLRVSNGYEAALSEQLSSIANDVAPKLLTANVHFWFQIAYSEMHDNSENMFGDYLYLRARLFAAR